MFALALASAFALAAPDEAVARVLAELNAASPPVGHVFLLDTSAGMEASTTPLRAQVADVVAALPAGDVVEVQAFHVRPLVALPPTTVTEEGRAELVERVRNLELSSGYDRDLGAGLDKLAETLSRADAPAYQHAFVVSSFCHQPSVASPWSSGGRGCSPIRNQSEIGARVAALVEAGRLDVRLFPLATPEHPVDAAGLDAASRELGGVVVTDGAAAALANYRARLSFERIAPVVRGEARAAAITARLANEPTSDSPVARLELLASTKLLTMKLEQLSVKGASSPVATEAALAPSAAIDVPLRVPRAPLSLFPRHDVVNVEVTVTADARLGPPEAVKLFGLVPTVPGVSAKLHVPVARRYGLSALQGALALALVFVGSGVAAVVVRGRMMPLQLGGSFSYRHQGEARVALDPALGRRTEVGFAAGPGGSLRVAPPAEALVVFRVRRPVWKVFAEVDVRADGVEINGRPASRGVHTVVPGAVSLLHGPWRLNWE